MAVGMGYNRIRLKWRKELVSQITYNLNYILFTIVTLQLKLSLHHATIMLCLPPPNPFSQSLAVPLAM